MPTRIRLRRMGRKKHPTYRIVVADKAAPRDGKFIESIGHYEPQADPVVIKVDREKALQWISEGALPSDTVKSLMRKAGVFRPAAAEPVAVKTDSERAAEEVVVEEVVVEEAADEAPGEADDAPAES
jgi:small subunit ribosomal protein S16